MRPMLWWSKFNEKNDGGTLSDNNWQFLIFLSEITHNKKIKKNNNNLIVLYFVTCVPQYQYIYIYISGNLKPSLDNRQKCSVYCSQIVVIPELKLFKWNNFLNKQVLRAQHQATYNSPEISFPSSMW